MAPRSKTLRDVTEDVNKIRRTSCGDSWKNISYLNISSEKEPEARAQLSSSDCSFALPVGISYMIRRHKLGLKRTSPRDLERRPT